MWQVLHSLTDKDQQAFMRFVTSCSRAPLGGFKYLNPPLTIHKVSMMIYPLIRIRSQCALASTGFCMACQSTLLGKFKYLNPPLTLQKVCTMVT